MEAVAHKTRKGFNLIEAAIVLAVVGGVIGGIWYAAANVMENYRVNKTVEGFLLTVSNTQNTMSLREAETAWGYSGALITGQAIALNLFPKDWVQNNTVKSPFGHEVNFWDYSEYPASFPKDGFMLAIFLPKSLCIKFIVALSETNPRKDNSRLTLLQVNYPAWDRNIFQFPISPEVAATGCTSSNNFIYAFFPYTRINN